MKIDGGCHCGVVTYAAEINPDNVIICHCTDCQTISGAPYRVNVPVLIEKFDLRGEPRIYVKTGGSGAKVDTAFCGHCGALYSSPGAQSRFVYQRAELSPKAQGFCGSAMPWAMDIGAVRRIPEIS